MSPLEVVFLRDSLNPDTYDFDTLGMKFKFQIGSLSPENELQTANLTHTKINRVDVGLNLLFLLLSRINSDLCASFTPCHPVREKIYLFQLNYRFESLSQQLCSDSNL